MNYQSKDPQIRTILDKPNWMGWVEFEVEWINKQIKFKDKKLDYLELEHFIPHMKCSTYLKEVAEGGHEIERLVHYMSLAINKKYHRFLHYGLTSSNVIDSHNHKRWIKLMQELHTKIEAWRYHYIKDDTVTVGMTHGRRAHRLELYRRFYTSIRSQLLVFAWPEDMTLSETVGGPTGNYYHRQAIGRDTYWPVWTNIAQIVYACELLATDYRFYCSDFAEAVGIKGTLAPGVATTSSAMPGKVNPTVFERVCSVGYMVRTLCTAQMLQPPKWMDADLVHSALERETVHRIFDHAFWVVETMRDLTESTKLEVTYHPSKHTSFDDLQHLQTNGTEYIDARRLAAQFPTG